MSKTFLILDAGYLCHRALHSMEGLAYGGKPTGVIYGFMKDCQELAQKFHTKDFLFCFDHGKGLRYDIYPGYKEKRQKEKEHEDEEKQMMREALYEQMHMLKTKWLPLMGFRNVFFQKGYEGDDMIAELAARVPPQHEAVIVTADKDMLQCIRENVHFYNPNGSKVITEEMFEDEWGMEPEKWADIKSLAGCATDEVKGLKGIGEMTAAKYLRDEMSGGVKFEAIKAELEKSERGEPNIFDTNLEVVKLPLAGTQRNKIRKDNYNQEGFEEMCKELGFKSLLPKKGKGLIKGKRKTFWDA